MKKNFVIGSRTWLIVVISVLLSGPSFAQTSLNEVPIIGAEIFIEPGQTPQEIDTWFKRMKESGMTLTRIRMFENYMHKPDGTWDYTLFDLAYKAGEKYGVKIYGNLFPATAFTDVGGFKFPKSQQHLDSVADYIKNLVTHFKQFKSSYGWVPINEPGSGSLPRDPFTRNKFAEWKKVQPVPAYNSKGYVHLDFAEERFLVDYNTWFLKWLTDEIRKYDATSPIHVNNHAIFGNVAEYNFPEWRKFLTSLGGSAHASWHFYYFNRSQYAVAMAANGEIIRSGAGNIPWLMTELQGGNNTYSGGTPLCPTSEEISQWLWTSLATGSKGAIFWCLNPRSSGIEAGEWAMLDFQNRPSDRLVAAKDVISVVNKNSSLFAKARVEESGINIIYIRESMWNEKKQQSGSTSFEGRAEGGVMKSALSYFEAVSEMGLQANFKEISEFDFSKNDYTGSTIILAHQPSIPSAYWKKIESFVAKGGKLIVEGLSAYYDENAVALMNTGFPFQNLFGGNISEYKMINNNFKFNLEGIGALPAHLWQGYIVPSTGQSVSKVNNQVVALRNKFGKGEVFWAPSLLGLAGRMVNDYSMLSSLLKQEASQSIRNAPVQFANHQPGMMLKLLKSDSSYIGVIINKSKSSKTVNLKLKSGLNPTILYSNKKGAVSNDKLEISAEETIVVQWK